MQMFSFLNRGVYGDAVHAPFLYIENPAIVAGFKRG